MAAKWRQTFCPGGADNKKPASGGSVRKLFLHPFWVWGSGAYLLRTANGSHKRFMCDKRMATLNICALVIPLFGFTGDLKAAAGMCRLPAQRTIHHFSIPLISAVIAIMIHHYSIMRTNYSISRSSIFTSSSSEVVKPLSGLTLCVSVVMIHSASSIGCLKPLTFTGISV